MIHVLIDTTHLLEAGDGFGNPDFQKALKFSQDGHLKIYVSHITWEERRTQILEAALKRNNELRNAITAMSQSKNILLDGFSKLAPYEIDDDQLKLASKTKMNDFATLHNICILPIGINHASRAWDRFFEVRPPFDITEQDRKNRRKDIPDSWILESAIDLKADYPDLVVLARDGKLIGALGSEEIRVITEISTLLNLVENCIAPTVDESEAPSTERKLSEVLEKSQQIFNGLDKKVLGYVAYFDGSTKNEILELLSRDGNSQEIYENIANRLVIANLITDSGNHYLVKDQASAELALSEVESEIILLLEDDN